MSTYKKELESNNWKNRLGEEVYNFLISVTDDDLSVLLEKELLDIAKTDKQQLELKIFCRKFLSGMLAQDKENLEELCSCIDNGPNKFQIVTDPIYINQDGSPSSEVTKYLKIPFYHFVRGYTLYFTHRRLLSSRYCNYSNYDLFVKSCEGDSICNIAARINKQPNKEFPNNELNIITCIDFSFITLDDADVEYLENIINLFPCCKNIILCNNYLKNCNTFLLRLVEKYIVDIRDNPICTYENKDLFKTNMNLAMAERLIFIPQYHLNSFGWQCMVPLEYQKKVEQTHKSYYLSKN